MKNQRNFSLKFKRQVVEELLSSESCAAQLCRKYKICYSLFYHWKDSQGRFNNEPTQKGIPRDRIDMGYIDIKSQAILDDLPDSRFIYPSIYL